MSVVYCEIEQRHVDTDFEEHDCPCMKKVVQCPECDYLAYEHDHQEHLKLAKESADPGNAARNHDGLDGEEFESLTEE